MILAKGGRRDRVLESITDKERLGGGQEGVVFDVEVKAFGKSRRMVEKRFPVIHDAQLDQDTVRDFPVRENLTPGYRNPTEQFRLFEKLKAADREKGLHLRLPATVRLTEGHGDRPTLLLTKTDVVRGRLAPEEDLAFREDRLRQKASADSAGFSLTDECFKPVRDKHTGRVQAYLVDFGLVQEKRP